MTTIVTELVSIVVYQPRGFWDRLLDVLFKRDRSVMKEFGPETIFLKENPDFIPPIGAHVKIYYSGVKMWEFSVVDLDISVLVDPSDGSTINRITLKIEGLSRIA